MHLEAAKLYLYALCFVNEQCLVSVTRSQVSTYSQLIMQQGLTAASHLISTFADIHTSSANLPDAIKYSIHTSSSSSHLLFYPQPCFTNLYFATIFLLRYLVTQPRASQKRPRTSHKPHNNQCSQEAGHSGSPKLGACKGAQSNAVTYSGM